MVGLSISNSISIKGDVLSLDANAILADDFEARVLADSGTFEAKQCLIDILNEINTI